MSQQNLSEKLGAALGRMSDRERRLVGITAAVAVVVFAAGIVYFGNGWLSSKEKRVASMRTSLEQILALESQYRDAEAREKKNAQRLKSNPVALFSLLQSSAGDLGLTLNDLNERKVPLKDSGITQVSVEVNLKQVSIDKLSAFLEKIEGARSNGLVKVTKLKVKTRFDNDQLLDVNMTVATWKAES
jgi:multidrug efflux pump subunit AcrB